jgi:hypothetical protein
MHCCGLRDLLTLGRPYDLEDSDALLPQTQADALLADKAFDADKRVIEPLLRAGKTPAIPLMPGRKEPRTYDRDLLSRTSSAGWKEFRVTATRYDKRTINLLADDYAASIAIWLNPSRSAKPTARFAKGMPELLDERPAKPGA